MPKIWEKAVQEIKKKGGGNPYAIATAALQKAGDLKPGTRTATEKGIKRGQMTKKERHETPASKMEKGGEVKAKWRRW